MKDVLQILLPFGLHRLLFVNLILQEGISLMPATHFTLFPPKRTLNLLKKKIDHSKAGP